MMPAPGNIRGVFGSDVLNILVGAKLDELFNGAGVPRPGRVMEDRVPRSVPGVDRMA
jgi:hypothetical protein